MKKIVQRTCIGCNEKKEKKELIRLVLNKQGEFFSDNSGKAEGRGIYICKNEECLEKARKTKKIEKTLGIKINEDLYKELRGVILNNEKDSKKTTKTNINGGEING